MRVDVQIHLKVKCVCAQQYKQYRFITSVHIHVQICFVFTKASVLSAVKISRRRGILWGLRPTGFTCDSVDNPPGVYAPHLACGVLVNVQTQLAWNAHSFYSPDHHNNGW